MVGRAVFDVFVPGESLSLESRGVWIKWLDEVGVGDGHFGGVGDLRECECDGWSARGL